MKRKVNRSVPLLILGGLILGGLTALSYFWLASRQISTNQQGSESSSAPYDELRPESSSLAQVGSQTISELDLAYKIKLEKIYNNQADDLEAFSLVALINGALEREVASLNGVYLSAEMISAERDRIDKSSKDPTKLSRIKQIFADDQASYNYLVVAPALTNQLLQRYYYSSPFLHQDKRQKMEDIYKKAVSSESSFEELAQLDPEVLFETKDYNLDEDFGGSLPESWRFLDELKPGEIFDNILEDENSFRIVKLIEKKNNSWATEALVTQKSPFFGWFKGQAQKVDIKFFDNGLKERVFKKYADSNLWWLNKIK